VEKHR